MVPPDCAASIALATVGYSVSPIFAAFFGASGSVGVSDSVGFSGSAGVFDVDVLPPAVVSSPAGFTSQKADLPRNLCP